MSTALLLWLDTETTGLDLQRDDILEMAWTITDHGGGQLTPLRQRYTDLRTDQSARSGLDGDPHWIDTTNDLVRGMHEGSRLRAEWDFARDAGQLVTDAHAVAADIATDLGVARRLAGTPVGRVHLAGAGVSHFDHALLRGHMPTLAGEGGLLHYRDVDTSVTLCTLTGGGTGGPSAGLDSKVLTEGLRAVHQGYGASHGAEAAAGVIAHLIRLTRRDDLIYVQDDEADLVFDWIVADEAPHRAEADVVRALVLFRLMREHPQVVTRVLAKVEGAL